MYARLAVLAACFLLLPAASPAQESCAADPAANPGVEFAEGGDSSTQTGSISLVCSAGAAPLVTVSGGGPGPGYDFSGTMDMGTNHIPFTGAWLTKPAGAGLDTPVAWTFSVTATNLLAAPPGRYATTLIFTIDL